VEEILLDAGKISRQQLDKIGQIQKESGGRSSLLLLQLGFVAEKELASLLSESLGLPLADSKSYANAPNLSERLSSEFIRNTALIPIGESDGSFEVAMVDPTDEYTIKAICIALNKQITVKVGVNSEVQRALQRIYNQSEVVTPSITEESDLDSGLSDIDHLRDMASEAPVIRYVNRLIAHALEIRASDIHIEPFDGALSVRCRVDGILRNMETPSMPGAAVVSRIKVMAKLNIAERRLPQDGRIKLKIEGRDVDMRISTVPTMHGESVVLRLLDQKGIPLDLTSLGFQETSLNQFNQLLARPHGVILVTGPTGSGKTTTLYAALKQLNTLERKILTVEDPIEYQLKGVNQIQVQTKIGLTFSNILRSILRQDPDVIMIGEMRDTETASIAIQSALTGHKVFSTLHTNDAPSSITRLLDMHIEDYLLTSSIDGVLAQRLVRRLCPHCREPYLPEETVLKDSGISAITDSQEITLYRATGCDHCKQSGYWGRTMILELLLMTDPVKLAILNREDSDAIRAAAKTTGFATMQEDALRKALTGITTLEEVSRVTKSEEYAEI
jgi:general secretion pathway protein E